jgi:hypothetical protein
MTTFARRAPALNFVCEVGDRVQVARRIVDGAVGKLMQTIMAVARRMGFLSEASTVPFDLVLSGGVMQAEVVMRLLNVALQESLPTARVVLPSVSAEVGSALLALMHLQ